VTTRHPFLAQVDDPLEEVLKQGRMAGRHLGENWVYWVALLLVVLLVVGWAVFIRKRTRRRLGRHHAHHRERYGPDRSAALNGDAHSGESGQHRKRRHRRHRHRQRNPTLAESGGLPPARGDSSGEQPA
jgi:flagellar biosynthesis/type III secretory pathway M-ring protein FliF/YscJ